MKKILFIDRDGTLVLEPNDLQLDSFEKLEFYPLVFQNLVKIKSLGFELVMVTNQDGLGTPSFPEPTFWPVQDKIIKLFDNEGITFKDVLIDRSYPEENSINRKPQTGMLVDYIDNPLYDLKQSYVIGDRMTDVELAKNLGVKAIFINNNTNRGLDELENQTQELLHYIDLETNSWNQIYHFLKKSNRIASIKRTTKETDIRVSLDLDGVGNVNVNTGLGFFNHLLDQIGRHGLIDLDIEVKGDLHVDEHHTIEDTALVFGEAVANALGDKIGIERYGFCLPMDDCLAQVALDFGGRSWLVWDADFKREKIGDVPTEMFYHFFKSFVDAAKANLNIKAEGINEHHKIESIFKAFSKALKMSVKRDYDKMVLPTTKGII